jgi:CRISPR-associated protein Cas1
MKDLHILPKVRDSWSHLYIEHAKIEQDEKAVAAYMQEGKVPVPCATLTLLMLGPGTSISHAAIRALAENGCMVAWNGEEGVRFYAQGLGETRSAANLLRQAALATDPVSRLAVVRRMYQMRFREPLGDDLTLQQIRGREGIRVREAYAQASRETGVRWEGRSYQRDNWKNADTVNRALSCANSCLYGIGHAAIVSAGYSPALGFIHTGKVLSFVYDITDLYKTSTTIPVAFRAAAEGDTDLEKRVRHACRDAFHAQNVLQRIIPDIEQALAVGTMVGEATHFDFDTDEALPGELWDPGHTVRGGVNYSDEV